jgi:3-oxoacyl-[acyl-carrier-protein] synthase III
MILKTGFYFPKNIILNEEFPSTWNIINTLGVESRRYVKNESATHMASRASVDAILKSGISVNEIDLIICASSAPQQAIPCSAVLLHKELGAKDGSAICFDVNSTCMSFLNALDIAILMLRAGKAKYALVCSSEIASVSLNPNDPLTAPLFGDAAAAVVLSASNLDFYAGSRFRSFSSGVHASQFLGAGTLHHPNDPNTTREMNYFQMDGSVLLRLAMRHLPPFLEDFLSEINLTREDIDVVIPHQASAHGLELLWRVLKFPREKVFINLDKRGNCVAASMPLALAEAVELGFVKRGTRVLMLGAAAGVTFGATVFTY